MSRKCWVIHTPNIQALRRIIESAYQLNICFVGKMEEIRDDAWQAYNKNVCIYISDGSRSLCYGHIDFAKSKIEELALVRKNNYKISMWVEDYQLLTYKEGLEFLRNKIREEGGVVRGVNRTS